MIAPPTLYTPSLYPSFILYFLLDKLTLLLLTSGFFSSLLHSLLQSTLLPLSLTSVSLFLLLELSGDEDYLLNFLLLLRSVRAEVFIMCHGLVEARGNTVLDNINQVVISHFDIDIVSIDIV